MEKIKKKDLLCQINELRLIVKSLTQDRVKIWATLKAQHALIAEQDGHIVKLIRHCSDLDMYHINTTQVIHEQNKNIDKLRSDLNDKRNAEYCGQEMMDAAKQIFGKPKRKYVKSGKYKKAKDTPKPKKIKEIKPVIVRSYKRSNGTLVDEYTRRFPNA